MIYGNLVGGVGMAQTFILQDEDGNEVTAVRANRTVTLDATAKDIRKGKKAATELGVTEGTADF